MKYEPEDGPLGAWVEDEEFSEDCLDDSRQSRYAVDLHDSPYVGEWQATIHKQFKDDDWSEIGEASGSWPEGEWEPEEEEEEEPSESDACETCGQSYMQASEDPECHACRVEREEVEAAAAEAARCTKCKVHTPAGEGLRTDAELCESCGWEDMEKAEAEMLLEEAYAYDETCDNPELKRKFIARKRGQYQVLSGSAEAERGPAAHKAFVFYKDKRHMDTNTAWQYALAEVDGALLGYCKDRSTPEEANDPDDYSAPSMDEDEVLLRVFSPKDCWSSTPKEEAAPCMSLIIDGGKSDPDQDRATFALLTRHCLQKDDFKRQQAKQPMRQRQVLSGAADKTLKLDAETQEAYEFYDKRTMHKDLARGWALAEVEAKRRGYCSEQMQDEMFDPDNDTLDPDVAEYARKHGAYGLRVFRPDDCVQHYGTTSPSKDSEDSCAEVWGIVGNDKDEDREVLADLADDCLSQDLPWWKGYKRTGKRPFVQRQVLSGPLAGAVPTQEAYAFYRTRTKRDTVARGWALAEVEAKKLGYCSDQVDDGYTAYGTKILRVSRPGDCIQHYGTDSLYLDDAKDPCAQEFDVVGDDADENREVFADLADQCLSKDLPWWNEFKMTGKRPFVQRQVLSAPSEDAPLAGRNPHIKGLREPRKKIPPELKAAHDFFYSHAGYAVGHRSEGALANARAEVEAEKLGYCFRQENDDDFDPEGQFDDPGDIAFAKEHGAYGWMVYRPEDCDSAEAMTESSGPCDSIWGVVNTDPSYDRVLKAELVSSCLSQDFPWWNEFAKTGKRRMVQRQVLSGLPEDAPLGDWTVERRRQKEQSAYKFFRQHGYRDGIGGKDPVTAMARARAEVEADDRDYCFDQIPDEDFSTRLSAEDQAIADEEGVWKMRMFRPDACNPPNEPDPEMGPCATQDGVIGDDHNYNRVLKAELASTCLGRDLPGWREYEYGGKPMIGRQRQVLSGVHKKGDVLQVGDHIKTLHDFTDDDHEGNERNTPAFSVGRVFLMDDDRASVQFPNGAWLIFEPDEEHVDFEVVPKNQLPTGRQRQVLSGFKRAPSKPHKVLRSCGQVAELHRTASGYCILRKGSKIPVACVRRKKSAMMIFKGVCKERG